MHMHQVQTGSLKRQWLLQWQSRQEALLGVAWLNIGISPQHDMAWDDPICKCAEVVCLLKILCNTTAIYISAMQG